MKIEKDTYVKILFRNGMTAEGFVDCWEEDNYILRSLSGESLLIIQQPAQDIMAIKVMLVTPDEEEPLMEEIVQPIKDTSSTLPKIRSTSPVLDKVEPCVVTEALGAEQISEEDLKLKHLAELHRMKIEADKEMVANKLRSHHIDETKKVEYGLPGFFKKPSTK